jgi:PAS domain S-box-containing protein
MLERIFDSSKDIPMMILDGSMKIQRVNTAFLHLFDLSYVPAAGSRLSDIDHHFWNSSDIKQAVSNVIVTNEPFKHKDFSLETKWGEKKTIRFDSKIIDRQAGIGRKIFIIMEDISSEQVQ